jgi:hypothetical protein
VSGSPAEKLPEFPTGCPEMPFTWAIADRGMGPVAQLYDVSMSLGGPDVMISRIR